MLTLCVIKDVCIRIIWTESQNHLPHKRQYAENCTIVIEKDYVPIFPRV